MKAVKLVVSLFIIYAGIVFTFESLLGYFQPAGEGTLVITTTSADGTQNDRVVARLESEGRLYVAANHWPRAWYTRALENPSVQITLDGEKRDYHAVLVNGDEHDRVDDEHSLPVAFRIVTGFPPRYFVRLDPS